MIRFTSIIAAILVMGVLACDEDSPTIPEEPTPVEYGKPFLQKPAAGDSIYLPYTFDWASRHDYRSYRLQISEDTSFANPLYDKNVGEDLRYAPDAELPEAQMYWRVGGVEEDTVVWSDSWPFHIFELRPIYQSRSCKLSIHGTDFMIYSWEHTHIDTLSIALHVVNVELERTNSQGFVFHGHATAEGANELRGLDTSMDWRIEVEFIHGTSDIGSFVFKEESYRHLVFNNSSLEYEYRNKSRIAGERAWKPAATDWVYEMRGIQNIRDFITSFDLKRWTVTRSAFTGESVRYYTATSLEINEDAFVRLEFKE